MRMRSEDNQAACKVGALTHMHNTCEMWAFHQAAEALATAYSKEILNESCREAIKHSL